MQIAALVSVFAANQTIGSNTAVTTPQAVARLSGADNLINTYAVMDAAFTFSDATTTCSYASVFPLSGNIMLRDGILFLNKDLVFTNNGKLTCSGRIIGNQNSIVLADRLNQFEGAFSFSFTHSRDQFNGSALTLLSLDWSASGSFLAVGSISSSNQNELTIFYFNGLSMGRAGSISPGTAHPNVVSIKWRPGQTDTQFACGVESAPANKPDLGLYNYNPTTLALTISEEINIGFQGRSIAWHKSGNYLVISRGTTSTSTTRITIYQVNATTFNAIPVIATTNANVSNAVNTGYQALSWAEANDYLAVGFLNTSSTAYELVIYKFTPNATFASSTLVLDSGLDISGRSINGLDWNPTGSYIAVGLNAGVDNLRIYQHTPGSPGSVIEKFKMSAGSEAINSVRWSKDGMFLAIGKASAANEDFETYSFDKTTGILSYVAGVEIGNTVNAVAWSNTRHAAGFTGPTTYAQVYGFASGTSALTNFRFDNANIFLTGDFNINLPITFYGNCSIYGGGRALSFTGNGAFNVLGDSNLKLDSVNVTGLTQNNVRGQNNSASLTIENSNLVLSNNYEFGMGSILFSGDNSISGTNIFAYTSRAGSTIDSNSVLYLDNGVTFSYAPKRDNRKLLYLKDKSSILFLDGASLYSTTTGIRLTRGTLLLDGNVTFSNQAVAASESIFFGDSSITNDLDIGIFSDSQLNVFGRLEYENMF